MSHSRKELYVKGYSDGLPKGVDTDRLVKVFDDHNCEKILDIGGGAGDFLVFCRESIPGLSVILVDISEEAVVTAAGKGITGYQVDVGDNALPFDDNTFDGVHCGDVIEHVFDTDAFINEVLRVLKPGGVMIVTTPNLAFWFNRLALLFGFQPFHMHMTSQEGGHIRVFTHRRLRKLLTNHSLDIEKEWGYGINLNVGIGAKMRLVAFIANTLTNWIPALASHMTFVCIKK